MPRNKYPELTVSRILEVSLKLFIEKGYDQVKMQDIVAQLGGLTKGAVYHHFKNKEDIFDALINQTDEMYKLFEDIKKEKGLNGLEKVKKIVIKCITDKDNRKFLLSSSNIFTIPRFLSTLLNNSLNSGASEFQKLIEEGNIDGSLSVKYPKQVAESFLILMNIWINPILHVVSYDEYIQKIMSMKTMFDNIGFPVFDEDFINVCYVFGKDFPEKSPSA